MKHYKNFLIVGIDHGYGNIKTANTVTPTGIAKLDAAPTFTKNTLFFDGSYFLIGEGHKEYLADKWDDNDNYLFTLMGIARELNREGITSADVHLAVGLSLTWVNRQREDFRKYMLQMESVDFKYEDKFYSIRIVGCSVFPQGYNSWLVGLIKCKECGYAVMIDIQVKKKSGKTYRYLIDNCWMTHQGCVARGYKIRLDDIEEQIYKAICDRIKSLEIARKPKETPDIETESIKADILRIDDDIRSLMDRMAKADDVVFSYIQQRIKELHAKKSDLERKLQTKARKHKAIDTKPLAEPLANWDSLSVQEKHDIAADMIEVIYISHNSEDIEINFGV